MPGFWTNGVSDLSTALTGAERIPVDTNANSGNSNPQVAALPVVTAAAGPMAVQVPTTGFTINAPDNCSCLIINPAGTLATGTLRLPVNPTQGQEFEFASTQVQTALTVAVGSGTSHTIAGAAVTALSQSIGVRYRFLSGVWYRTQ